MRAPRKGYQAGIVQAVVVPGTILNACLAPLLFVMLLDHIDFRFLLIVAPAFVMLPPAVILLLLPKRTPRRIFSPQRVSFPYARIGQAAFRIGCCATLVGAWLLWRAGSGMLVSLNVLVFGCIISYQLIAVVRFFEEPVRGVRSFVEALAADARPPVVFMRAFEREGNAFVSGDPEKYARFAETPRPAPEGYNFTIPFDEYLKRPIERLLGPFLALGNPQDYFTPAGAVRAYFKDETWMEEFRELAGRASCFLIEASESSNLRWELQFLKQSNLHDRLLIVTGHPTNPLVSPWKRLVLRMSGVGQVTWDHFTAMLSELGYDIAIGEPEFGSVIGFDAKGRAHVLSSDADLPAEFIEPIVGWLANHRNTGSCIQLSCTRCGGKVFKRADRAEAAFVCRTCRAGSPFKQALKDIARWVAQGVAIPAFLVVLGIPALLGWEAMWVTAVWFAVLIVAVVYMLRRV